jgi:hypothetical protein
MFDPLDFDPADFETEGAPLVAGIWWDAPIEEKRPRNDDDEVLALF